MKYQVSFTALQLAPIASTVLTTVCVCLYWFLFRSDSFKAACMRRRAGDEGLVLHMMLLRSAGLLILGVLPYLIFMSISTQYGWKTLGISFNSNTALLSLGWIAGVGVGVMLITRMIGEKQIDYAIYPQMRVDAWDIRLIIKFSFFMALYFLGHEMLFRGLLLFPLADHYGFWFAVAINTGLCTVAYLPRGPLETLAVLIFCPLLCFITLQTETIWASWIIHCMVAVAYSMLALKHHPVFYVVWNRRPTSDECEL